MWGDLPPEGPSECQKIYKFPWKTNKNRSEVDLRPDARLGEQSHYICREPIKSTKQREREKDTKRERERETHKQKEQQKGRETEREER